MKFFRIFDTAASGMTAERFKMDVISNNIANAHTSKTLAGTPYRRQVALIEPKAVEEFDKEFRLAGGFDVDFEEDFGRERTEFQGGGVRVAGVAEDQSDFRWVYDPGNPNAEKEGPHKGYVAMPNVNIITEMTHMIQASRGYEANATAVEAAKAMAMKALEIGSKGGG